MAWLPLRNLRAPSQWAREAPPVLTPMAAPGRLLVPLDARVSEAKPKPPGTLLSAGEALTEKVSDGSHVPVAPIDGRLGKVQPIVLRNGRAAMAVELETTGASGAAAHSPPSATPPAILPGELAAWVNFLRNAGIWADRCNNPDLIAQLNQSVFRPIDTILCSMLDSDPALRLNAAIGAAQASEVCDGVHLLSRLTGARRAYIVMESGAPSAWKKPLQRAARERELTLIEVPNDYPQADPTLMLFSLVGRRLPPGKLPTEQGVILLDAPAAAAIGRCVKIRTPMISVPLAVLDHDNKHVAFLDVPIGTPLAHALQVAGIHGESLVLRGGDLLRDVIIPLNAIVGGGELTVHVSRNEVAMNPEPCIRCGWCVQVCPTYAHPALLLEAAQRSDSAMAGRGAGLAACIECGVCSHVCPSNLPLLHAIRGLKK